MKQMTVVFIAVSFLMLLCVDGTAQSAKEKQSTDSVLEQTIAEQKSSPIADDKPDEIQVQYLTRLMNINLELKNAHTSLLTNYRKSKLQHEREMLELQYRGRIPRDVEMKSQELKNEEPQTREKINNLEKEKDNLKLDALKYYRGKMPKWLAEKWQEEENNHSNVINEDYTKKLQEELRK